MCAEVGVEIIPQNVPALVITVMGPCAPIADHNLAVTVDTSGFGGVGGVPDGARGGRNSNNAKDEKQKQEVMEQHFFFPIFCFPLNGSDSSVCLVRNEMTYVCDLSLIDLIERKKRTKKNAVFNSNNEYRP